MSSSSSSLPTPRQLLTSLLNAISEIPPPPPTPDIAAATARTDALGGRTEPPSSNPLKRLDPSHRPLFTTLHVLFPSLLLPALDLLDRGLVTRLTPAPPLRHDATVAVSPIRTDGRAQATSPASSAVYVVRSAQQKHTSSRRRRPNALDAPATAAGVGAPGQASYLVHVAPWHCTCAAFAFAAFPPAASALPARSDEGTAMEDEQDGDDDGWWGFGGMSFDGWGEGAGDVPPCCKHLLACVLAERWAVLAGYVSERRVGREELAGIYADI